MLVAKSDEAHWRIARQFENRTIQKTYVALCHGVPQLQADVIDMPIGKDKFVREKQAVRKVESGGKPAITLYQVQETFPPIDAQFFQNSEHASDKKLPAPKTGFSFLKLSPKTGRTHQLRVHMSANGFPMVGDTMYGGREIHAADAAGPFSFDRQALHAAEITFVHPATLNTITLQAPLPPGPPTPHQLHPIAIFKVARATRPVVAVLRDLAGTPAEPQEAIALFQANRIAPPPHFTVDTPLTDVPSMLGRLMS